MQDSVDVHVAHLVYGLGYGGLERVVHQLATHLPAPRYRHSILCITDCEQKFSPYTWHPWVALYPLHKKPGQDWGWYLRLWRLLRQLRPQVLHTCNLAACEGLPVAALAGVKGRLHVEHGRDSYDPDGTLLRYLLLRRLTFLFAQQVVGVSDDLCQWLIQRVGVPTHKVVKVTNGVDIHHFRPGETIQRGEKFTVGFVGRLWPIKSPATLVEAVALWRLQHPQQPFCLQVVGDGPLRQELEALAQERGVAEDMEWLGWRQDVAELLPNWQALLLPSLAEGTPLTVLEAMSCGVPVIASKVGGLPAVVRHGETGLLIPPADPAALAEAMDFYFHNPHLVHQHGLAGREWVVANHSLQGMVANYELLFRGICSFGFA